MEDPLGGFGERSPGLDSWPDEAFIYLFTDLFYEPHLEQALPSQARSAVADGAHAGPANS